MLLPVPGTVSLWHNAFNAKENNEKKQWTPEQWDRFVFLCDTQSIETVDDFLFIPLFMQAEEQGGIIITDIDPMILGKMSAEYLHELQQTIQEKLLQVRLIYIESLTGQYNSRCLLEYLRGSDACQSYNFLFLLSASFRSRSAVTSLQKIIQIADLLKAVSAVPVFCFSGDMFALIIQLQSGGKAFEFSHKLIKRLKREGALKVHVGFTSLHNGKSDNTGQTLLESCWQALGDAEKRGPFSMCSSQDLDEKNSVLLKDLEPDQLSLLSRAWKGLTTFGIILFRTDNPEIDQSDVETSLQPLLPEDAMYIKISQDEGYLLLPERSALQTQSFARNLFGKMQGNGVLSNVSLGVCSWPCLRYSKAAMVMNCRKALMHGFFTGPGSCTIFDHISLNVSGDYFFDEGDYRQAVKDYQMGLLIKPDDINIMNSLGVSLTEMNRLKPAVGWFMKVLKQQEDNYMALVNLGFAKRMMHQEDEALQFFEKAYRVAADFGVEVSVDVFMQLGKLYCQFGRFDDAVQVLEKCEEKGTGKQEFYLYRLLGEAYMECGRNGEGMQALQRALKLYPRNAESISLLGLLYFEAGQGEDIGLRLCRKALESDELNADNWYRLGRVLYQQGNIQEAFKAARRSIALKRKDNPVARFLLGKIYERNRQYYLAGRMYNAVLKVAGGRYSIVRDAKQSLEIINEYRAVRNEHTGKRKTL